MKAYVINMERSKARREAIETQLKQLKIDYTIVSAVDGRGMTDDELNNIIEIPGEFTKSQAGCMLSHCKAYEALLQSEDEYGLVLEDDVLITDKQFRTILDNVQAYLNKDHVTLLTYYWCRENSLILKKKPNPIIKGGQDYYLCAPNEIHGIGRAAAYILSREVAERILNFHSPKLICQADSWVVYYDRKIIEGVDCMYPMPVTENPQFGSEIGYTRNKIEALGKKLVEKAININMPIISTIVKKKRINFANTYKNIILENSK